MSGDFAKLCPGSRLIRQPAPEFFTCPQCGNREVEIWTDELKASCDRCGATVFREVEVSCIDWCQYARECIGEEKYNRLRGQGKD